MPAVMVMVVLVAIATTLAAAVPADFPVSLQPSVLILY